MKKQAVLSTDKDSEIELSEKLNSLKHILSEMGSVLVAYSGGADSTFLLKMASSVLGDRAIAVTASSETYLPRELEEARKNAKLLGVKHIVINTNELDNENFAANPPERCYFCKQELFSKLLAIAKQYGLNTVADGSNYDDLSDFRPGMTAGSELGIRSPLKEAMLTKADIRTLSREMNLSTWDKPSTPCLSTRFPYGTRITKEKLSRVERAEQLLAELGIRQLRVRVHEDMVRIEVPKEEMHRLIEEDVSNKIVERFKSLGYTYITLDLQGYRMGSMNESLKRTDEVGH